MSRHAMSDRERVYFERILTRMRKQVETVNRAYDRLFDYTAREDADIEKVKELFGALGDAFYDLMEIAIDTTYRTVPDTIYRKAQAIIKPVARDVAWLEGDVARRFPKIMVRSRRR